MSSETNKTSQVLYLLLSSILLLSLITYTLPNAIVELYSLKKIDFLEPILIRPEIDSSATKIEPKEVRSKAVTASDVCDVIRRPCSKGIVCLKDFSENKQHLGYFLEALYQRSQGKGNCRIAFYGDSFIEGDILTTDLRDTLQQIFGGKGVGFLPISSPVSMFRKSLPFDSDGWDTYTTGKTSKVQVGISGQAFIASKKAEMSLYPPTALSNIRLFYKNEKTAVMVHSLVNKKEKIIDTLPASTSLQSIELVQEKDSIKQYKLQVEANKELTCYGLSIENGEGLYLDNFSIRGNSGLGIASIPDNQLSAFQSLMDYKLVVLQFGLNVAAAKTTDFSIYEKKMTKMILHLKTLFPETTFLLISTSDRSCKNNGTYATMPSIPLLVEAQERIAEQSGILFWNMYQAMGGENSMVDFVKHKPAWANKDYTHLTFPGGKKIARELAKSFLQEYNHYQQEKKVKYEPVAVK